MRGKIQTDTGSPVPTDIRRIRFSRDFESDIRILFPSVIFAKLYLTELVARPHSRHGASNLETFVILMYYRVPRRTVFPIEQRRLRPRRKESGEETALYVLSVTPTTIVSERLGRKTKKTRPQTSIAIRFLSRRGS